VPVLPLLNETYLVLLLAISPLESTPWVILCLYAAHTLLGVLHVRAESEFPNSNHVGVPFEPSVSVVVCHAICFDPAWYELIPRSDPRSSDVY
jgi:hypothetical protein